MNIYLNNGIQYQNSKFLANKQAKYILATIFVPFKVFLKYSSFLMKTFFISLMIEESFISYYTGNLTTRRVK